MECVLHLKMINVTSSGLERFIRWCVVTCRVTCKPGFTNFFIQSNAALQPELNYLNEIRV